MKTIIVNKENNGKNINNFLIGEFPTLSTNSIYKALRKKDIRVNDTRINKNITVFEGDIVKVFISDSLLYGSIKKVYEDENILVVNKPCGIEVTRR